MTISSNFALRILQLALLMVAVTGVAFAQSASSEVNGTVKDSAGAVVSGATLKLIDTATNSEVTSTSGGEGAFVFANVRPGVYRLITEHTGFSKKEVQNIQVNVGVPYTVNVELTPGGFEEVVTVSATDITAPVNTTNAELSTTVQTQQINDLPLNGRNPLDLAGLQAGVSAGASNRTATINGLRGTFSNLTWDGININDGAGALPGDWLAVLGEPGRSASVDDVTVVLMFGTPSGVVLSPQDPSLLGRAATDLPIREGYVLSGLDPAFIAPTSQLPKLRGTVVAIALSDDSTPPTPPPPPPPSASPPPPVPPPPVVPLPHPQRPRPTPVAHRASARHRQRSAGHRGDCGLLRHVQPPRQCQQHAAERRILHARPHREAGLRQKHLARIKPVVGIERPHHARLLADHDDPLAARQETLHLVAVGVHGHHRAVAGEAGRLERGIDRPDGDHIGQVDARREAADEVCGQIPMRGARPAAPRRPRPPPACVPR